MKTPAPLPQRELRFHDWTYGTDSSVVRRARPPRLTKAQAGAKVKLDRLGGSPMGWGTQVGWGKQGAGRQSATWCAVTDELQLIDRKMAGFGAQHLESFQSKREARRYIELRLLTRADKISHLRRQVTHKLCCPSAALNGTGAVVTTYTSDFEYVMCAYDLWGALGEHIVEDCKGFRERMYLMKKKWLLLQEGIVIYET